MTIKSFKYTKKKDGETKNYLILLIEETDEHIGGLDLSKLEEDEITKVAELQAQYEMQLNEWKEEAEEQGIEFEELMKSKDVTKHEEEMKPFFKKAYRKFLISNIQNIFDGVEKEDIPEGLENPNADGSY